MTTKHLVADELGLVATPPRWQRWGAGVYRFARTKPVGAFGGLVVTMLVFTAIFADVIAPYDPNVNNMAETLRGPSLSHLAGTDQFGRDVFSRVIHGARISIQVGIIATLLGKVLAVLLGMSSAFFGGWIDYWLQRIVDTIQSVPGLILLIAIVIVLGPGIQTVIIALAFNGIWGSSRLIRSATLGIIANPYVEAARVTGCSNLRIMLVHILPNILPVIIISFTVTIGGVILAEASLSFLGYGVPPPNPSWGGMMSAEGRNYMIRSPWILIAPTIALSLVVFSINMFGDALRDKLDPRLRGASTAQAKGS